VDAGDAAAASALSASQVDTLIALLDLVRASNAERGAARTMAPRRSAAR
jgi:hypothetical protein